MTQDIPQQYQPQYAEKHLKGDPYGLIEHGDMNTPSHGEKSRSIDIDGTKVTIPTSRSSELESSRQTKVTGNINSTPGYFRIMSPFLTVRYGVSSVLDTIMKYDAIRDSDPLQSTRKVFNDVLGRKTQDMSITQMVQRQVDVVLDSAQNGVMTKEAESILGKTSGGLGRQEQAFENLQDELAGRKPVSSNNNPFTRSDLKKDVTDNIRGKAFDASIGLAMAAATTYYTNRVLKDIVETYAETVAHELYKDPKEVNAWDVFRSENKIVKETCSTFLGKTAFRYATDALSFGRFVTDAPFVRDAVANIEIPLFKNVTGKDVLDAMQGMKFGDAAMGIKGLTLLSETQRKHTSFFIDLTDLIDNKINPQKGLGDPINASNLLDLYQKYELNNDPEKVFSDATRHDTQDDAKWRTANVIFSRMAELMNETYKYKHGFNKELTEEQQLEKDVLSSKRHFALPKFIYLLGNDLIDPGKPEQTLAYAEVANSWSIQDVKILRHEIEVKGTPLHVALQSHPVDIEATLGNRTPPELVQVSRLARMVDQALVEEGISKDPEFKELHKEIIDKQRAEMQKNNATKKDLPNFFPARGESFSHGNENNIASLESAFAKDVDIATVPKQEIPDTQVRDAQQQNKMLERQEAELLKR